MLPDRIDVQERLLSVLLVEIAAVVMVAQVELPAPTVIPVLNDDIGLAFLRE